MLRSKRSRRPQRQPINRYCRFCAAKTEPDYKNSEELIKYTHKTGKISSRKFNGNCAKHQRRLASAIKRARFLGLLSFSR